AQRPILREVFRQLEDRMTRYEPVYLKLFPTPETRPRQREVLIEIYRKGEITDALLAFKKIYLEVVDQLVDHLKGLESEDSSSLGKSPPFGSGHGQLTDNVGPRRPRRRRFRPL